MCKGIKLVLNRKALCTNSEKCFTLVELLIVIAILGAVASVVVLNIGGFFGRGFALSSLVIAPEEVEAGIPVTVKANVMNTGKVESTYTVSFTVDGMLVDTKQVTVGGGATETVFFMYSTHLGGLHKVQVDGLTATFIVLPTGVLPPHVSAPHIMVAFPKDKSEVPWRCKLQGTSQEVVPSSGLNVYLLVYPIESNGHWWVQPPVTLQPSGYWEADAYFGRDPTQYPEDAGDLFYVIVIATQLRLEPGQQWYSLPDYSYRSNAIQVRRE